MSLVQDPGVGLLKTMTRFPEKLLRRMEILNLSQAKVAKAADVNPSQFSKWTRGIGKPTSEQLLLLSRCLQCSMEHLADDDVDVIRPGAELTEDEVMVLRIFRTSELSAEEAVERLLTKKLGMHPRK